MLLKYWKGNKIMIITIAIMLVIFLVAMFAWQIWVLKKAHSTFESYYAFRGCTRLIEKTDDYGICKVKSAQTIKIVKYDNRWFLDGDLPCGFLCF